MEVTEVEDWFRERGFGLVVDEGERGTYWAHLSLLPSQRVVAPSYGRGATPAEAVTGAKQRSEIEQ